MKLHTLIDGKYFLQSLLEKGEIVSSYHVWHSGWEKYLVAKAAEGIARQDALDAISRKDAATWIELGVHPNLVSAYFWREIEGVLWLFLEDPQGETLAMTPRLRGKKVADLLAVVLEIARGMAYLHAENVAHGNLNKENILLCHDGRVRIANIRWQYWKGMEDLSKGLRSPFYSNLTKLQRNAIKKSVHLRLAYQPPEYFLGNAKADVAGDSYSFGVLAYELFTSALPISFPAEELERLFAVYGTAHGQRPVEAIAARLVGQPEPLIGLVLACLSPNPAERPKFSQIIVQLEKIYREIVQKPYVFETWHENTLLAMSLNNQALGYLDIGQWEKAEKILQEVNQLDNQRVAAVLNLNLLKLRKGTISLAQFFHDLQPYKAVDLSQSLLLAGKVALEYGSFIPQLCEEIKKVQLPDESLKMLQANFYYRLKDYRQAWDIWKSLVDDKRSQDFWYRLGAASFALKLTDETQQAWELGVRHPLPLWDLTVAYGMLLAMKGKWSEARCFLDNARQNLSHYLLTSEAEYVWSHVQTLQTSSSTIFGLAISSDQQCIRAWSKDGLGYAWEWPSGKHRDDLVRPAPASVSSKISPDMVQKHVQDIAVSTDGHQAVTLHGDNLIRVWDLKKNSLIYELTGHTQMVTAIAITPNGRMAISAGMDKTVKIWNLVEGLCLASLSGHDDYVSRIAISPDATMAISGGWDKTVRVWDLLNERCFAVFDGYQGDITALAFNANGRLAITADTTPTVQIWNIPESRQIALLECPHSQINTLFLAEDGLLALAGTKDGQVYVYEDIAHRACPCWVKAGYLLETLPLAQSLDLRQKLAADTQKLDEAVAQEPLAALRFCQAIRKQTGCCELSDAAKRFMATTSSLNLAPKKLISQQLASAWVHDSRIVGFVHQGEDTIFTLTEDGTLRRWNYCDGRNDIFWQKPSLMAISLEYGGNGTNRFCISGKDNRVQFWDPERDEWVIMEGHAAETHALRMLPHGQLALSGSCDGTLQLWDLTKENLVHDWKDHPVMITDLAVTTDGLAAVAGFADGSLYSWELPSGKRISKNQQKSSPILCLALPPQQHNGVISGSLDGSLREWNLSSGMYYNVIKAYQCPATCLHIHPGGRFLASGGMDGIIKLWDLTTHKSLAAIPAHAGAVTKVMISPDYTLLYSCGEDRTMKVWLLEWEWAGV